MPKKKVTRGPGRPPAGRVKVMVSLDPPQLAELRKEAFRRAAAGPRWRPDVSEVIREAVGAWIAKRK